MPEAARATKSQGRVGAYARATSEIAVPATVPSITGRRPMRSETRPQIGANTNCIAAWVASRHPSTSPFAPKRSA